MDATVSKRSHVNGGIGGRKVHQCPLLHLGLVPLHVPFPAVEMLRLTVVTTVLSVTKQKWGKYQLEPIENERTCVNGRGGIIHRGYI